MLISKFELILKMSLLLLNELRWDLTLTTNSDRIGLETREEYATLLFSVSLGVCYPISF